MIVDLHEYITVSPTCIDRTVVCKISPYTYSKHNKLIRVIYVEKLVDICDEQG